MSGNVGKIGWIDMTVDDASGLREFYQAVVGWVADSASLKTQPAHRRLCFNPDS